MRIVDIRERAIPLKSNIANSSFDFSEMTTSVVAVMTDVVRDGRPVVGFAFNSTGRYACGAAMRARFIPRILGADPRALLDQSQENFDPGKILAVMMQREKSGGHSERSIAIGTIEVAVWDAVAKIAGKPLHRMLAERYSVEKLEIFGSYVRSEQKKDSDLDVLVTFKEDPSLLTYIAIENYLSDLLGIKVDLVMKDSLKPKIGQQILREAIPV